MLNEVYVEKCDDYSEKNINKTLSKFDHLFAKVINKGNTILLKPNWIAPHHKYKPNEWTCVITHPNFIYGVLKKCVQHLGKSGKIIIADGPQTDSSFKELEKKMMIPQWTKMCSENNIEMEIIDLRDNEWIETGDVIIKRKQLRGDPMGFVEFDLKYCSEFKNHKPSRRGYYGADYDTKETNTAHTRERHLYRVSRTAINADVFINLPKMKTHKKAGITCSLKNLVGINTYKNYLPHYSEGTPFMGGDQFSDNSLMNYVEMYLLRYFKSLSLKIGLYSKYLIGIKSVGKNVFGDTRNTIRGGNWHGNDTIWRMILDLNKLLLYGNEDGTMRDGIISNQKKYLTVVDAIIAGEGNGPEAPDAINANLIFAGTSPVAVDCLATRIMGFNYKKIPTINNSFTIDSYPIVNYHFEDIVVKSKTIDSLDKQTISSISSKYCLHFKPHFGWVDHIEL